jgi:hypothetical protein
VQASAAWRSWLSYDEPGIDTFGYLHTFVSGIEVYAYAEPTGDLPGRLIRGAKAAMQRY